MEYVTLELSRNANVVWSPETGYKETREVPVQGRCKGNIVRKLSS